MYYKIYEKYDNFLIFVKHCFGAFLGFPKIKPRISSIFMTVSSDAKSLDSNLTKAIFRSSIYTSVSCIHKKISFVSSYLLVYFVPANSS